MRLLLAGARHQATAGHPKTVSLVLHAGADFEALDINGDTPLAFARDNKNMAGTTVCWLPREARFGRWS